MATATLESITRNTVDGLGFDLVEVERASRGLVRVFIDRRGSDAGTVTVEDCVTVSNHLTRVLLVETIDYDRLEVSSPGLDRPLKSLADFERFAGQVASVRMFAAIEARKRFEGVIVRVEGDSVVFSIRPPDAAGTVKSAKSRTKQKASELVAAVMAVPFANIERARLVPDI